MSENTIEIVIKGTQKREWGSSKAICYICKLGEGIEPCVYYEKGVGKEGVGNNCPWFICEDSIEDTINIKE